MERLVESGGGHARYPGGRVVAAIDPAAMERLTEALTRVGVPRGEIGVITIEDIAGFRRPFNRTGPIGFVNRFLLSLGDDLDEIEGAAQELEVGHVIVAVVVNGNTGRDRIHDILLAHGGHAIAYFGRWTITSLP